jgi:hypothetical protein
MHVRAAGLRRGSLKDLAERLRSLMRFLHRTGRVGVDLAPRIIGPTLYAYKSIQQRHPPSEREVDDRVVVTHPLGLALSIERES